MAHHDALAPSTAVTAAEVLLSSNHLHMWQNCIGMSRVKLQMWK